MQRKWLTKPDIIENDKIDLYLKQCFNHWRQLEITNIFIQKQKWKFHTFDEKQQQFIALGLTFEKTVIDSATINILQHTYNKIIQTIDYQVKCRHHATIQDLRRSYHRFREFIIRGNSEALSSTILIIFKTPARITDFK